MNEWAGYVSCSFIHPSIHFHFAWSIPVVDPHGLIPNRLQVCWYLFCHSALGITAPGRIHAFFNSIASHSTFIGIWPIKQVQKQEDYTYRPTGRWAAQCAFRANDFEFILFRIVCPEALSPSFLTRPDPSEKEQNLSTPVCVPPRLLETGPQILKSRLRENTWPGTKVGSE